MKKGIKGLRKLEHWHIVAALLMIFDIIAVNFAYFLALWFRFDCAFSAIEPQYLTAFLRYIPIHTVVSLIVFLWLRMYNSIWRFASFDELLRAILATVITSVVHIVVMSLAFGRMPISYYIIGTAIQFALVLGVRFSYRFVLLERSRRAERAAGGMKRAMLIGAGSAGQMILRDVSSDKYKNLRICCIIDDNSNKWGRYIGGVPVVGGREAILENVRKYRIEKILLAIPSAKKADKREILDICKDAGCEMKDLPGIYQLVSGEVTLGHMQDVAVEDLLGREPIQVDLEQIGSHICGKAILVTGGGGSIGSELCRQVAAYNPKLLVIFDVYENNAYDIEQELREKYPRLNLKVLIGSVRDSRCIENVFSTYKPEIVYHAAAHKHVPLMETSPCEAIKNNVIGTYKTAYAALLHGCSRFVLISTDKAVNPTNIMGASKRLCEMVVQSFDRAVKTGKAGNLPQLFTHRETGTVAEMQIENACTEFVAVRFGNVLGSNGSVIPLFKKQIRKGGPVTVTHPDIIRYFMTIPEAVSLVMQAGVYAAGGEIFVLDMGAPVKIDELARNLIKLSGHTPDVDIQVVYTGLRPGEKLYEEKLMAEEGMQKTPNDLIHIGNPIPFDTDIFLSQLRKLMDAAYENDEAICDVVAAMVPTYRRTTAGTARWDATYEELYRQATKTH
ncbi:MAG: polysaccharide biosynthesis protein [Oscillospiraceae bacterium]|nr:polysaccharide biosynthesis protein [Oscillospiraceae bacterium]